MSSYYKLDYNGGNFGGTIYYKISTNIEQNLSGGEEPVKTSIIMTLTKSANSDGTVSYTINWLNQMYEGCTKEINLYYEKVFEPILSKVNKGSFKESNEEEFTSMYAAVEQTIDNYFDSLKSSESFFYGNKFVPAYNLIYDVSRFLVTNGRGGGTTVQCIGNNKSNKNAVYYGAMVGSASQEDKSNVKNFYNWFDNTTNLYESSFEEMDRERFTSKNILKDQLGAVELYPVWKVNERGFGGLG